MNTASKIKCTPKSTFFSGRKFNFGKQYKAEISENGYWLQVYGGESFFPTEIFKANFTIVTSTKK